MNINENQWTSMEINESLPEANDKLHESIKIKKNQWKIQHLHFYWFSLINHKKPFIALPKPSENYQGHRPYPRNTADFLQTTRVWDPTLCKNAKGIGLCPKETPTFLKILRFVPVLLGFCEASASSSTKNNRCAQQKQISQPKN